MTAHPLAQAKLTEYPASFPVHTGASCGWPSPATDFAEERLSLDSLVHLREPSCFLVKAEGDSMTGVGIYDGDVLVVDKARQACDGDTVVACLGAEFVVKTLKISTDGTVGLVAENPNYDPIILGDGEELEIWGVATWNLHQLSSTR